MHARPERGLRMTDESLFALRFENVLVAHHSPQNDCFADEGNVLYPPVPRELSRTRVRSGYYFVCATHPGKRCKFGWVKRTKPFGVKDFVAEYPEIERSEEQYELLADLLSAIANLPERTPVAGSYFRRGIEQPRVELSFHKVFFYPAHGDSTSL